MPSATTKPVNVTYIPLDTPADMGNALSLALGIGYRGTIEAYADSASNEVWHIQLIGPGNPLPVNAALGDVLIWDATSLTSMTQAVFLTKYTSTP